MDYKRELSHQLRTRLSALGIQDQIKKSWKPAMVGMFYLLTTIGFIVLIAKLRDTSIEKFTKDPADIMHYPAYIGALSNLGNLLWAMTTIICLFGAIIVKQHRTSSFTYHFFLASGIFSFILGMDDLFLLHDHVLPHLLHIPEGVFYFLYLITIIVILIYFLPLILKYEYLLLGTSVVLFGLSRCILIFPLSFDPLKITADLLKHSGTIFWLIFFYRAVLHEVSMLIPKNNFSNK